MTRDTTVVFGPPGTGKTTHLLEVVRKELEAGTPPNRIGFVSFSRRAVREAAQRANALFPDVSADDLEHFRTIHSTAFHMLGLTRADVLQTDHMTQFSTLISEPFRFAQSEDELCWDGTSGDKALGLYQMACARDTTLETEWQRARLPDLSWTYVRNLVGQYQQFKERHCLWDFSDMISQAKGDLPLDVLIVDEAQDTSRAQWDLLRRAAATVPRVYLAGDDDQSIYAWSGADDTFLHLVSGKRLTLPTSYRLPREIKKLADKISQRIRRRIPKTFESRVEAGAVHWARDLDQIDLHRDGTWLLLARSNYQLADLRSMARRQGVVYSLGDGSWSWALPAVKAAMAYERLRKGQTVSRAEAKHIREYLPEDTTLPKGEKVVWDNFLAHRPLTLNWMEALTAMPDADREYVRALRRAGESLTEPGRVRIGTVHNAKGTEADHVVLLTDISRRVQEAEQRDPDAELRVQYVGVTRARKELTLIQPSSPKHWTF